MMWWVKGTEVNRLLVLVFMFIWLGVRLYLLLAVTIDTAGYNFL